MSRTKQTHETHGGPSSLEGFTLIELLVVIAIIGILATIVLVFISGAKKQGVNKAVDVELRQFRTQMEVNAGSPPEFQTACNGPAIKNIVTNLIDVTGTPSSRLTDCYLNGPNSTDFSGGASPFLCGCRGLSDWVFWIDLGGYDDSDHMTCIGSQSDIIEKIGLNGAPGSSCVP